MSDEEIVPLAMSKDERRGCGRGCGWLVGALGCLALLMALFPPSWPVLIIGGLIAILVAMIWAALER